LAGDHVRGHHRFEEHTGEVRLELGAPSLEELFVEAGRALAELMIGDLAVGGVAATLMPDGVISPGGIGFDVNCGVRLLASRLTRALVANRLETFVHELSRSIPTGYGRHGRLELSDEELDRVLGEGCPYVIRTLGLGLSRGPGTHRGCRLVARCRPLEGLAPGQAARA
jgi:hypothetical protein